MICPRTNANCPHGNACCSGCGFHTVKSGMALSMEHLSGTRADAKMAEIERLVDAMVQAFEDVHTYGAPADIARYKAARTALIDWVRPLLEKP